MAAIGSTTAPATDLTEDSNIDPATGLPKTNTVAPASSTPATDSSSAQLPYQQVNNTDNIIPLTAAAQDPATNGSQATAAAAPAPAAATQATNQASTSTPLTATATTLTPAEIAGNNQVLTTAQNVALNQTTNPLVGDISNLAQYYTQNPNLGFDYTKYNQNALEQYDQQQSQAQEAARRQLGATSQSGELQNTFLQNEMKAAAGRENLSATNDYNAAQAEQKNTQAALTGGEQALQSTDQSTTSQIGNLATTRSMAEGQLEQNANANTSAQLSNLGFSEAEQEAAQKQGYDLQTLTDTYGFQATQAAVNHGYDLDTMAKQFGNTMTQLMATQDFTGAQAELSREATAAIDANDTASVTANLQKQLDYNSWALQQGQTFTAAQNAINNALQVSLKTMDIQGQKDLATLNGQIQSNQLMTSDDFKASEDALDRSQQTAIQNGDIAGQLSIQNAKAQLDQQAQAAQNAFTAAQTIATQNWQTGERIGTEDAAKAAQYFDWAQKNNAQTADFNNQMALQLQGQSFTQQMASVNAQIAEAKATNDTARAEQLAGYQETLTELQQNNASVNTMDQETLQGTITQSLQDSQNAANQVLETQKENNALAMQTQDMDQQTKMAYLNDQLLTAQKDGDVGRQQQIIGFQTTQTLETQAAQGNIQAGLDEIQGQIQSALSSQNYVQADALQTSAQTFKAIEDAQTNSLTQEGIDLQKMGFDYNAVQEAVANGQIKPDAAAALVADAVKDLGITVVPADPNQIAANVLKTNSQQEIQYASTNPKNVNPAYLTNGAFDPTKLPKNADGTYDTSEMLTAAGQAEYYDSVNKTLFGTTSTAAGTNAANAVVYDPTQASGGTNKNFTTNPPAAGSTFKIGDTTYTRTADAVAKYEGDQSFTATDQDGQQVQIVAGKGVIRPGAVIYDNGSMSAADFSAINAALVKQGAKSGTIDLQSYAKGLGITDLPATAKTSFIV